MLCVLLAPWLTASSQAQLRLSQLEHRSWTSVDSAPTHLYDVVQAPDGRLLLSAVGGLYWFNGLEFSPVRLPDDSSVSRSGIFSLLVTRSGVLWADSYVRGVLKIDHGHVRTYGAADGLPGEMNALADGGDGTMWGQVLGDLYCLRGERWYDETKDSGLTPGELEAFYVDRAGNQWAITKRRLFTRMKGQASFLPTSVTWDGDSNPQTMIEAPDGSLWIGLVTFNSHRSVLRELDVPGHPTAHPRSVTLPYSLRDAKFDRYGALWITGKGLQRVAFPAAHSSNLSGSDPAVEVLDDAALSSEETHGISFDRQGNLWLTTLRGLDRFNEPVLTRLPEGSISPSGLPALAVGNGGSVWIGSKGIPLLHAKGESLIQSGPAADRYFCLYEDLEGRLWYDDREGLWMQQGQQRQRVPVPAGVEFLSLRQVLERPDHVLVFLFLKSVWSYDGAHWAPLPLPPELHGSATLVSLDATHHLWVGTSTGSFAMLGATSTSETLQTNLGTIQAAFELPGGFLLAGDSGLALVRHGVVTPLQLTEDLTASGTSGIVRSEDGSLWLNSGHGILRIRSSEVSAMLAAPATHLIQAELLTEADIRGPAPVLYDLPTAAVDGTGRLWFNTSDTVVHIDPARLSGEPLEPVLSASDIAADGVALASDHKAPPGAHTIRISYFGTNLTHPESVHYRYKLDGVDDVWQSVGSRTEAVYTRLRPGIYHFHVEASNGGGLWSAPADLAFHVQPSFFQTIWFYVLCFLAALAAVALLYRIRVWFLIRSVQETMEARANERILIARDLHDTLLQGFQGVMLNFHVASQQLPANTRTRALLEDALTRADEVLISGRNSVGQLRSETVTAGSILAVFHAVVAELQPDSAARMRVLSTGTPVDLQPAVSVELMRIGREALLNAWRHANAMEILLTVEFQKTKLQVSCQDDGKGIDPAWLQSSRPGHYGLLGMRERAEQIGANFQVTSSGEGTRLQITIPAHRAYRRTPGLRGWLHFLLNLPPPVSNLPDVLEEGRTLIAIAQPPQTAPRQER